MSLLLWRGGRPLAAACAIAAIVGCSDDPTIDPLALEGKWTYEMSHFTGGGATCRSTPQTTWSNKYAARPDLDGYQWSLVGMQFTCVLPGADTQHWTFRDGGFPSGNLAYFYLDIYTYDPVVPVGCLMPTDISAVLDDSVRTRILAVSCTPAPEIGDHEIRAVRSIQFRFPDTTGAPIYTLSGATILRRP